LDSHLKNYTVKLVQLQHSQGYRRVGIVEEPNVVLLHSSVQSSYELFNQIIHKENPGSHLAVELKSNEVMFYDDIYEPNSTWSLLPPIDCPADPLKCMLSGTGLTHKASAENRQKMHESQKDNELTDSMKMYMWGEEGGKPEKSKVGVQPEWFYKGNGLNLKGYGQPLHAPNYAKDGGEEPEIAGVYLVSKTGIPVRLGFVQANEFSDHVMEKTNYLYLAPSKIRNCAIGPELALNTDFTSLKGNVKIIRDKKTLWSKSIHTGEQAITHTLSNLEHHHFKYDQHRIPGQLHIHFFGADAFSFGEHIQLEEGDQMYVSFENMGRPLVNPLKIDSTPEQVTEIKSLNNLSF
jgi:hypothetical protein